MHYGMVIIRGKGEHESRISIISGIIDDFRHRKTVTDTFLNLPINGVQ